MKEMIKDPNAVLDYKFDFKPMTHGVAGATSDYLEVGETIIAATVTATAGLTVVSSSITDSGTSVTAWLSGGTVGEYYTVTCHIHTSATLREDDRSIIILIEQK